MSNYLTTLHKLNRGHTVKNLDEELKAVIEAIKETGSAGSVTLKLEINPSTEVYEGMTIVPKISSKVPRKPQKKQVFFVVNGNQLQDKDPNQPDLDGLEVVPEKTEPVIVGNND